MALEALTPKTEFYATGRQNLTVLRPCRGVKLLSRASSSDPGVGLGRLGGGKIECQRRSRGSPSSASTCDVWEKEQLRCVAAGLDFLGAVENKKLAGIGEITPLDF